jgi:energy-coupling factor transporter ATP-binding protein EcfA2/energy-coupling factor transporter transmembrane protein EcfT
MSVPVRSDVRPVSPHAVAQGRPGGPLRAAEVADAGVFGALAVIIVSVGTFLPHFGVVMLLSAVPFAVVGLRNRGRAVLAAAVAAGFVAFLAAGAFASVVVAGCAVLGGPCGIIRRRGRGSAVVALLAAVLAPVSAAALVGLCSLFAGARNLTLQSLRATITGVINVAETLRLPVSAGDAAVSFVTTLLGHWAAVIAAVTVIGVLAEMGVTNALLLLIVRRVAWLGRSDPFDAAARADAATDAPVAPVPLEFVAVGFGHRGAAGRDALTGVSLTVEPGEFVAVVGPNGAGKSTLVSLLAGAEPTSGAVIRPGRVGLGQPGGTAVVAQRAEAQVIGSTVGEDLRWGLPPGYPVDAEGLLASVGLAGLAAASTESLSGGQLQRLAIAAAMARRPALLISDESTSMLDAAGRAEILDLLASLPARAGTAVVHVTHDPAEAARADRVIGLADGRLADAVTVTGAGAGAGRRAGRAARDGDPPDTGPDTGLAGLAGAAEPHGAPGEPVIRVRGAGHRFDAGTPWEVTALRSVDLDVREGEGLLVTGRNGSGKSTLAWLLAGLIRPTEGTVTIDGVPAAESAGTGRAGAVALSFQHARLQLQRPTVGADILAAAGFDPARPAAERDAFVAASLHRVGLPAELAGRGVDELSGGQMRRVAIAGLLASRPRVLVLDEPLAGLDRDSRRGLLELLGRMRRAGGLTLVVISHDLEDMDLACTRTVEVTDGTVALPGALSPGALSPGALSPGALSPGTAPGAASGSPPPPPPPPPPALPALSAGAARAARRPRRGGLVFRAVPGTSALHRLGPATKILILAAATLVSLWLPGWPTIGLLSALLVAGVAAARLPATVLPRVPWPVTLLVALGGVAAAEGSGVVLYLQSMLLTVLFFALSLLLVWTTRVEDLPAAFTRIAAPLRGLGAPVSEWAHTMTFAVRTLPLLRDEFRVLVAGRRLRAPAPARSRRARAAAAGRELLDLVVAVVASSGRRAADLGRAATQRGGLRPPGR